MSLRSCFKLCASRFAHVHQKYPFRMGSLYVLLCVAVLSLAFVAGAGDTTRQNIVLIIADDLGWNDVSFHGSDQVLTPNIDSLAYSGVALERYYSHCVCTPSRAALLTGKYAYATGMQGYPLTNSEDRGLPIKEKILPQYLKELGYATHLVGKWHVGSSRTEYLPMKRGFDTHFGHRGGFIDYYEYTLEETWSTGPVSGMGLFRNETAAWGVEGYITDVYNKEALSIINAHDASAPLFLMLGHSAPHGSNDAALLQAPWRDVRAMRHVESPARRIFAAMMKRLDDSVGDVVEALDKKGILDNTIIVFISDNGGMTSGNSINYASNWPLRGLKMSPFEGGVRVAGAMWTPRQWTNHAFEGYFHVADWLPTLLRAVGAELPTDIDGVNIWDNLTRNKTSPRQEIFDIDDFFGFAYLISGEYKLVTGEVVKDYSNYQGGGSLLGIIGKTPSYTEALKTSKAYQSFEKMGRSFNIDENETRRHIQVKCEEPPSESDLCYPKNGAVCLYNIKDDPCERRDLSKLYPDIVAKMLARIQEEKKRVIPRVKPIFRDPRSHPSLFNYTWTTFADSFQTASGYVLSQ